MNLQSIKQAHEEAVKNGWLKPNPVSQVHHSVFERAYLLSLLERMQLYMRHDELCGIHTRRGECTCELVEILGEMK